MSFGGIRATSPTGNFDAEVDDEDDGSMPPDSSQRIGMTEGAITLEQVCLFVGLPTNAQIGLYGTERCFFYTFRLVVSPYRVHGEVPAQASLLECGRSPH